MNIGDIFFQLIVFFMIAAVISAAIIGSKYAKNRKAQLDRIEKKLNSMSEDQND
ncbi:hypothetical protein ACUUYQ_01085 [Bacillus halotolerans]|jgi:hypothetical protein|uniref:YqjU n=1 Tax=Bacillus mojavensis TaxID=72360 RepID=A0AAP3CSH5_BACMO|nr:MULTISPECIES: hypothetical protein [Bacillus]MCC2928606.1 hypothetical protein [Bacillus sp. LBG-1-113]MCP9298702.1 hypothetical protein [Bacillus halotolerans]MCY8104217.1 hypothetical protein [Bacillus mojavensis]MCY8480391.1 hypothetical protein [Bacillus mojavensis]MCY8509403.1 hypothetical protein [Bacillus mojavensis]